MERTELYQGGRRNAVNKAMASVYPSLANKDAEYLDDYSRITYFLHDVDKFSEVTWTYVEPLIQQKMIDLGFDDGRTLNDKEMSQLLTTCVKEYDPNFAATQTPAYLTGAISPSDFGAVVTHKLPFTDGLSVIHGEYAHTMQWLTVAAAQENLDLGLDHPVSDLYSKAVQIKQDPDIELMTERGEARRDTTAWDFTVDCATQMKQKDLSFKDDDLTKNIFSNTARGPAWVQYQYLFGEFSASTLGQKMRAMYQSRDVPNPKTETNDNKKQGPPPPAKKWLPSDVELSQRLHASTGLKMGDRFRPPTKGQDYNIMSQVWNVEEENVKQYYKEQAQLGNAVMVRDVWLPPKPEIQKKKMEVPHDDMMLASAHEHIGANTLAMQVRDKAEKKNIIVKKEPEKPAQQQKKTREFNYFQ